MGWVRPCTDAAKIYLKYIYGNIEMTIEMYSMEDKLNHTENPKKNYIFKEIIVETIDIL